MPIVNNALPSLIGGVSQQPPAVRHTSQLEAMDNLVPSLAAGLRRRSGAQHVSKIAPAGLDHQFAFVHTINRGTVGDTERYFVVIDHADLKVYDLGGTELPVSFPNGKTYLGTNIEGTAAISPPRDTFSATSVADYTFIVNKNVYVVKTGIGTYVPPPQNLFVVVKLGVVKTSYFVTLDGTVFSYTTPDTDAKTTDVYTGLAAAINASGTYSCIPLENLLVIKRTDNANFTWSVTDSYGNQAMFGFVDQVNRYEQLPQKFLEGPVIRVCGDPNNADASFYVTWQRRVATGSGVWVETIKPGLETSIAASTMPHILVRNADNTFTFKEADWAPRDVGDDDSNPFPSFVGSKINDVFFHRNRLGFLADENVVLSQAAAYFKFFATSARALVDSDPIDVSASTTKVTILRHAVPFDKSFLVVSDKAQFQFSSDSTLTPKTARLDPTTAFEASTLCPPAALGRTVFFATNRGNYTALREYYYDGNTVTNDAVDVTAHVPSYVPSGVFRIVAAPTEDALFALTTQERDAVYVYNSSWSGDEKVQSSWHRWKFNPQDVIISADVWGSTLTLLVQRQDGLFLERIALEDRPSSPASYTVCLDRWTAFPTGNYHAGQQRTFWTLPYTLPADAVPVCVVASKTGEVGQGLTPQIDSANTVSLRGDYRAQTVCVGVAYTSSFTLSQLYSRDTKSNAVANARVQLRDMTVEFDRTGYFEARVQLAGRDEDRYVYSGRSLGGPLLKLGVESIGSGKFTFPIMGNSEDAQIRLVTSSHLPAAFISAEWQGHVAMTAQRR